MMSIRFIKGLSKLHRQLSTLSIKGNVPPVSSVPAVPDILDYQRKYPFAIRATASIDTKIQWNDYWNKNPKIENPITTAIIETPLINHEIIERYHRNIQEIELPPQENGIGEDGIQAAVMIGIRRKKMRKHKLKKLRKRMRFEWAKVRQRRELRKEKAFQAVLINQIKEAEKFSAEEYVAEKLRKANETPIPKYWKGKRLPEFIIREKMGLK
ncbi:hypothetical protein Bhyg_17200 [Pseudolycoriella hygida]|uniref:Small ribosomal subunit protein mS38 n=1 Tax=Pseudolycoriella hygida TaxID=35572 RepID=A0A9Q0RUJ4_9DIPT|nr:hypothetical protein Bhyg_17200 [Pseudolycoriella hygida]